MTYLSDSEDPFDRLLDLESDEEFGALQIRDKLDPGARPTADGNLNEWSAQDFASIYVRFRPHLERHAKRYLSNSLQAEEVVQDAFLYLMTSLPELDSELGVLKFLKWKVRNLAYDVHRAASSRRDVQTPEFEDVASQFDPISEEIERAEDNAVIRLALSRLNPKQREALYASAFEEKSTEEVAQQIGLTPNATRQLLFRARKSFKTALVGEAEMAGKSLGEILSLAAKKAAMDARENAAKVGAILTLAAVGVGIWPSLTLDSGKEVAAGPVVTKEQTLVPASSDETEKAEVQNSTETMESDGPVQPTSEMSVPVDEDSGQLTRRQQSITLASSTTSPPSNFDAVLATNVLNAGVYTGSYASIFGELFRGVSIEVFGGTGISAFLDYDFETRAISQAMFQLNVDGKELLGIPQVTEVEFLEDGAGNTIVVLCEEFFVVDNDGNVFSDTEFSQSVAVVTLELSESGAPTGASMKVEK